MATSEMRAKLVLEASTKGGEKIEIIADDLEKLAAAGGEAAPKFQVLAAELRALGQQQALINQFAALKTQTGDYADEAAKAQAATKGAALALKEKRAALAGAAEDEQRLGKLADEYAAALDNIDARQQQLNASNGGAARGVADLEMRLIELNGTEDEIARARYERDQAEVRRQIELQKLELERAAIRGEDGGRIQQEIDLLNKQLGLMERVFNEEKKQAKARQRDKNTGSDGGSGGGSSGGSGGGASRGGGTFNITLNANGINDPVQLARQLVPELKKLDRLAR